MRVDSRIHKIRRIFFTIFIVGILLIIATRVVKHYRIENAKLGAIAPKDTIDGITNSSYGSLKFFEVSRLKGNEVYLYRVFIDTKGNTVFGREIGEEKDQKMVDKSTIDDLKSLFDEGNLYELNIEDRSDLSNITYLVKANFDNLDFVYFARDGEDISRFKTINDYISLLNNF